VHHKDGWKPPDLNGFTGFSSLLAFGTKPVKKKYKDVTNGGEMNALSPWFTTSCAKRYQEMFSP